MKQSNKNFDHKVDPHPIETGPGGGTKFFPRVFAASFFFKRCIHKGGGARNILKCSPPKYTFDIPERPPHTCTHMAHFVTFCFPKKKKKNLENFQNFRVLCFWVHILGGGGATIRASICGLEHISISSKMLQ